MRFTPALALRFAEAIGMAAAGAAGGAGAHHYYSKSGNKAIPSGKVEVVDPFSEGKRLGDEQIEMAKFLWSSGNYMNKKLIDYGDRDAWLKKAKDYSIISAKWPGDIIFIQDKSDASLARLLRDKCYSVSRWFLNKQDQSLDDNNQYLKEKFKNAKDSFTLDNLKELCSTENSTEEKDKKGNSITNAKPTSLRNLPAANSYTCDDSKKPESGWMKEIYDLKKNNRDGDPKACDIVKDNIIVVITYSDESEKYEIRRSQQKVGGGYISVPREDWTLYSSLEELPGFNQMLTKKSK